MRGGRGEHGGRGATVLVPFHLLRVPGVLDPLLEASRSPFPALDRSPPVPQQGIDQWGFASGHLQGHRRRRATASPCDSTATDDDARRAAGAPRAMGGPKTLGKGGSGPGASRSPGPKLIPLPPSTRPKSLPMPPNAIILRLPRPGVNWCLWPFRHVCARWRWLGAIPWWSFSRRWVVRSSGRFARGVQGVWRRIRGWLR